MAVEGGQKTGVTVYLTVFRKVVLNLWVETLLGGDQTALSQGSPQTIRKQGFTL